MSAALRSVSSIDESDPRDLRLIEAVQDGLPLVSRPYAAIANQIGMEEPEVITRLGDLLKRGVIKRLGVVVRHHELGYRANAMVVWDIPDRQVDEIGLGMKRFDCITLCYRRPRRPPAWPYNLFCMIHGRSREGVELNIERLAQSLGLEQTARAVLFSRRRFKQCGARFAGLAPRES